MSVATQEAQGRSPHPGLSVGAIALSIGLSPTLVGELLAEDCRRGIVVRTPGGWRLSAAAESAFGPALRSLGDGPIRLSRRRGRGLG